MQPKVTIIMATYNRAHFIKETLNSISAQTYSNWECLIIDDGGKDNTKEVISPILEKDSRFRFLSRPNGYLKGLPGCRNYGLDLAEGNYIIFFDDDDIVHPQNLELCVQELEDSNVYFCRYIRNVFFENFDYNFDFSKEYSSFYIDEKDIDRMLKNELPFNSCAVMWTASCFKENRFIENLMYAEEWELYSRIISSGFRGISIEKCLFFGRKHPNSNTGEFYSNNSIRRNSYVEAILLVVENLKKKQMLSSPIKRYFVTLSIGFKEYDLFKNVLKKFNLSPFEQLKWHFFYITLPFRLFVYKQIKALK